MSSIVTKIKLFQQWFNTFNRYKDVINYFITNILFIFVSICFFISQLSLTQHILFTVIVEVHSDSERGNPLPPHGLLFPISSKVLLYASFHRQDNTYHGLCYPSRGALAGTRHSSMGPPRRKDRSDDPSHHERTLLPRS